MSRKRFHFFSSCSLARAHLGCVFVCLCGCVRDGNDCGPSGDAAGASRMARLQLLVIIVVLLTAGTAVPLSSPSNSIEQTATSTFTYTAFSDARSDNYSYELLRTCSDCEATDEKNVRLRLRPRRDVVAAAEEEAAADAQEEAEARVKSKELEDDDEQEAAETDADAGKKDNAVDTDEAAAAAAAATAKAAKTAAKKAAEAIAIARAEDQTAFGRALLAVLHNASSTATAADDAGEPDKADDLGVAVAAAAAALVATQRSYIASARHLALLIRPVPLLVIVAIRSISLSIPCVPLAVATSSVFAVAAA
eukprot:m.192524 g.192524  ORF g.192524 m.192524 type:complete len:308 (+) comp17586_c2_seq11:4165-5088(+)